MLDIISIFWCTDEWIFGFFWVSRDLEENIYVNIELQIQSSVSEKRHKIVHKYRKWKQNKTKNIRNVNDWFHFHRTSNCLTCKYSAKVSYLKIDCNVCVDKCSPEFNHVERLKTAYDCAYFYCSGNSYCFQEIAITALQLE